ncbi:MAG: hypothetical protein BMS9Abin28_2339 [Anaerolineae bacterium]|nr:MAG: hypothetical protein BMS9Abin28_2339 [Anaerolineae bacterium]
MYQSDTEILFPMRVAPHLRSLRGSMWQATVDRACNSVDASPERLALTMVMIRLAGCLTCHPHSYRAIRGCTSCAKASIRRFRGEDQDLENLIDEARGEVLALVPQEVKVQGGGEARIIESSLRGA